MPHTPTTTTYLADLDLPELKAVLAEEINPVLEAQDRLYRRFNLSTIIWICLVATITAAVVYSVINHNAAWVIIPVTALVRGTIQLMRFGTTVDGIRTWRAAKRYLFSPENDTFERFVGSFYHHTSAALTTDDLSHLDLVTELKNQYTQYMIDRQAILAMQCQTPDDDRLPF